MLRPLLMAGGLNAARIKITAALRSAMFGVAAGLVLALALVVALGFTTAAGFIYFAGLYGPVAACLIMAGLSLAFGVIAWMILHLLKSRVPAPPPATLEQPAAALAESVSNTVNKYGIKALLVIVAAGFLIGRSTGSRK